MVEAATRIGDILTRLDDDPEVVLTPQGRRVSEADEIAGDEINRGGEKISVEEVEDFAYQVEGVEMGPRLPCPIRSSVRNCASA